MAKKGFTGSDIYFQDKFDEFDFWTRYNRMKPKEGFAQMWKDYKDSTKMEEGELGKIPPIPPSVLKSGLGFILKQLAGGKFNQGKRDFLEKMVKPPKPKPKVEKIEPFKFDFKGIDKIKEEFLNKLYTNKKRTLHAKGGIAGMLGEPRSGYNEGGYMGYWKMVQDKYYEVKEIDPEKFGNMSIQDFAKEYYPRPGQAEGGRIGLAAGGDPRSLLLSWLIKQGPKAWKWMNKPGNNPLDLYKKYLKSVKDRAIKGDMKTLAPEMGILAGSGIMANRWAKKKLKEGMPEEDKAQGGRIGLADGMTPSESWMRNYFFSEKGESYENRMSFKQFQIGPGIDLWNNHIGKAKGGRIGYDNGGPTEQEDYDAYVAEKEGAGEEYMEFDMWKQFQLFDWGKAQGGRIGFKDGEGIMSRTGDMVDIRNVPYYAGEGLKGLVNSAETLSKFPLAAGKLGSDLLREKPNKEMFMEAIENITPGSWSENLGLTSLVEGMGEKRPKDAQTVGGILGLGTEIAVPTGGAFKAGQLLLSKASKAMGKVKDGKTLEKLVDEKLTDAGQSRRDFNILAAISGLGVAFAKYGLGGLFKAAPKVKPTDDVVITLKTFIDDSDVMTEAGPVATGKFGGLLDVEGLTKAAQKTLVGIMKDIKAFRNKATGKKNLVDSYEEIALEEGSYIADALTKAGHKVRLEHLDDVGGSGVDEILWKFKNDPMYKGTKEGAEHYKKFSEKVKKMTERERFEYHNSLTDDYHNHYNPDVEELLDVLMPVKKAEGGRIGLGTGGPPIQFGIAEKEWEAKHPVQGTKFSQLKDAAMDKVLPGTGLSGHLNMGDFEAFYNQPLIDPVNMFEKSGEPQYGLQYEKGPFSAGVGVMPDGETKYGFKLRKEFNDGGLTKTVPPKRGPDPQGLPSALYNGIMRPRSY